MNRTMRRTCRMFGLWAVMVLPPAPGRARVFSLTAGGLHGATTGGQPGWTRVFEARYRINEGSCQMEALGCSMAPASALQALQAVYQARGGTVHLFPGQTMGWGFAQVEDHFIRFLAVPASQAGESVVFRTEQSLDEFRSSMTKPGQPRLKAVPPPESGRVVFFAANEKTRTELEIMESDLPLRALARQLKEQILSAGWKEALPRAGGDGLRIIVRNHDLGLWLIREGPGGQTQILRLFKRGAAP